MSGTNEETPGVRVCNRSDRDSDLSREGRSGEACPAERCERSNLDADCAAMAVVLLDHVRQHLLSEMVIPPQDIAAYSSALRSIHEMYAEIGERYGIRPDESCDAKKAIEEALERIETIRRSSGGDLSSI
jgi:hypothetical protein